jgi:hypothetical protein
MILINNLGHVMTVDHKSIKGGRRVSANVFAVALAFGENTTTYTTVYAVSAAGSFSIRS